MDTKINTISKNTTLDKRYFYVTYLLANIEFWEKYPDRFSKMGNLWDLFLVQYDTNIRSVNLQEVKKSSEFYFNRIRAAPQGQLEQEAVNMYLLGTNFNYGPFMENTGIFVATFANFLALLEYILESPICANIVKSIIVSRFWPRYETIIRDSQITLNKKIFLVGDILSLISYNSQANKLEEFKLFLMRNQNSFKYDGLLSNIKEFFGYEKFQTRMNRMSLERLAEDKYTKLPHVVVFISGFTSEDTADASEAWGGFTKEDDCCNFMAYNWESSTALKVAINTLTGAYKAMATAAFGGVSDFIHETNPFMAVRNNAKIFGQFLAYIIYTNSIFKQQNISIVGFSLVNLSFKCLGRTCDETLHKNTEQIRLPRLYC
jgi:hypothetical protein